MLGVLRCEILVMPLLLFWWLLLCPVSVWRYYFLLSEQVMQKGMENLSSLLNTVPDLISWVEVSRTTDKLKSAEL